MHPMPISPEQGATSGGTEVTITGSGLSDASAVHFGPNLATFIVNSATQVTAVSPAGCGAVETSVTSSAGTSNPVAFYYIQPPFVDGISSRSGPTAGGNTVTLSGVNLTTATSVAFGTTTANPTVEDDGSISVVVPAGVAGSVSVTVTTAGGTDELPGSYRYVDGPTIDTVSPASGPNTGGTAVLITGADLSTATSVTFDGADASFVIVSDTQVSVSTPVHLVLGSVDVVVTTATGAATDPNGFEYVIITGI
jgi:hypothetical protein